MGWIDVVFGILLILNILSGIKNGFFEEIGTFAGLIAGICAGISLREETAQFLLNFSSISLISLKVMSFFLPFILVFLFFVIMAKVLSHFFKAISMGWVNRSAGGLFCLFKGVLILSLIINLYEMVDRDRSFIGHDKIESSLLYKPIEKFAPGIFPSLKKSLIIKKHDADEKSGNQKIVV